jgi:hypothetical protein
MGLIELQTELEADLEAKDLEFIKCGNTIKGKLGELYLGDKMVVEVYQNTFYVHDSVFGINPVTIKLINRIQSLYEN